MPADEWDAARGAEHCPGQVAAPSTRVTQWRARYAVSQKEAQADGRVLRVELKGTALPRRPKHRRSFPSCPYAFAGRCCRSSLRRVLANRLSHTCPPKSQQMNSRLRILAVGCTQSVM